MGLLAAAAAAMAGCGDDAQVGVRAPALRVMPEWFGPTLKATIADADRPDEVAYAYPDNVGFEWGVEATIRYHKEDTEGGLDAPSFIYVIDEELDRRVDPVGTTYSLGFGWWQHEEGDDPLFRTLDDGVVELLHQAQLHCEPALCAELQAVRAAFTVDVELTGEAAVPLRALALHVH